MPSSESDSDDEKQYFLQQNKAAFKGVSFDFEFNGKLYLLPKLLNERFIFLAKLGVGSFGTVFEVFDSESCRFLAAKLLDVSRTAS